MWRAKHSYSGSGVIYVGAPSQLHLKCLKQKKAPELIVAKKKANNMKKGNMKSRNFLLSGFYYRKII